MTFILKKKRLLTANKSCRLRYVISLSLIDNGKIDPLFDNKYLLYRKLLEITVLVVALILNYSDGVDQSDIAALSLCSVLVVDQSEFNVICMCLYVLIFSSKHF